MTVVPKNNTTFEYFGPELLRLQELLYRTGRESRIRLDVQAEAAHSTTLDSAESTSGRPAQQPLFPVSDPLERLRASLNFRHAVNEEGRLRQCREWNRRLSGSELKAAA